MSGSNRAYGRAPRGAERVRPVRKHRDYAPSQFVFGPFATLMVAGGDCDAGCADRFHYLRQVRLTTGKDRDRVVRVRLVPDAAPSPTRVIRK